MSRPKTCPVGVEFPLDNRCEQVESEHIREGQREYHRVGEIEDGAELCRTAENDEQAENRVEDCFGPAVRTEEIDTSL